MKIAALSDTHLSLQSQGLPEAIANRLRGVGLILHVGDVVEPWVLKELASFADVAAVAGNMDPPSLKRELPEQRIVEVKGFRIGLAHGSGPPWGLRGRVMERFLGEEVDAIVYGHSHGAECATENGILFLNPGSATGRFPARSATMGLIHVNDHLGGEIIKL